MDYPLMMALRDMGSFLSMPPDDLADVLVAVEYPEDVDKGQVVEKLGRGLCWDVLLDGTGVYWEYLTDEELEIGRELVERIYGVGAFIINQYAQYVVQEYFFKGEARASEIGETTHLKNTSIELTLFVSSLFDWQLRADVARFRMGLLFSDDEVSEPSSDEDDGALGRDELTEVG